MMITQTKEIQKETSPQQAINALIEGNNRFITNNYNTKNYSEQINLTSQGQYPFAAVLSCIDSRVPVEIIFDQGIGDLFSTRVAGNIVNEDVLGSIEYACGVAGSKLVLVLGHTSCGAVTAACKGIELGNITTLLSKIKPAVDKVNNAEDIEAVAKENVLLSVERIRKESSILSDLEKSENIKIVGAIYDVSTGKVNFI